MVGEGGNNTGTLGAEILLEFNRSIENIKTFGDMLEGLDGKFGSIESRVNTLRNSLSGLSTDVSRRAGTDLRRNIENEINNIVAANGLVLTTVGVAPFRVRQDTVRHIFRRIDAELNRAVLRSIGNIQIQLDPSLATNRFSIGGSEFTALNNEIARLVRTQVRNLVAQVRREGGSSVSPETMTGLELDIGRETVKQILQKVKAQLLPVLLNPQVPVEGMNFSFNRRDMQQLVNRIRSQIVESFNVNLGTARADDAKLRENLTETTRAIDRYINQYVASIRQGMGAFNVSQMQVPVENLSQSLRRYIARDLGVTAERFNQMFQHVSAGEASTYELRRQFGSLEDTINSKVRRETSQIMTELKRTVREVDVKPNPRLRHHLIHEINRLNNDIVRKVREQIDRQFQHMRAEIETVNTAPRSIRRAGRLRSMTAGELVEPTVVQQAPRATPSTGRADSRFGADPYARRDAHFASFGLEGAVINTFRHILAGGMVGAPMMAMYQAIDTFQASQMEQLKIFQNFMLKDNYQTVGEDGSTSTDYTQVNQDVSQILDSTKELSALYGIGFDEMSQVAGIASRLTSTVDEARQFVSTAGIIQRLDSEGDIVESIAPGLEAIMGQFQKSIWQMDETVRAFVVATNRTKATSDEIMAAMARSGASYHNAGVGITDAVLLNAIAIQNSGESGERIGNMAKTIMTRLAFPTTQNTLGEYGIDVYERNEDGRQVRRDAIDILSELANLVVNEGIGQDEVDRMFYATAGGYQISRVMGFLKSLNTLNNEEDEGLNLHDLRSQVNNITDEDIQDMLSRSLSQTIHNMNRAQTSTNLALVSVLESLRPQIDDLTSVIINVSDSIRRNSDTFAELITFLANTLVGFGAIAGVRRLGRAGGYGEAVERHSTVGRLFRGRDAETGRVNQGTLANIIPSVGGALATQLADRSLWERALRNETLAPVVQELANMDANRQRELVAYMARRGTPNNLEQFFGAVEQSRGYSPAERLSAEDRQRRAAVNAQRLADNTVVASRVSQNLLMQLSDTMNNRTAYLHHNASAEGRGVTRALTRMDESQVTSFGAHLQGAHPDRQITSMRQLNDALRQFSINQAEVASKTRAATPAVNDMGRAIQQLTTVSTGRPMQRAREVVGGFLDSIPSKARGAGSALVNLGRQLRGIASQVAIMFTVGDYITTASQNALMSENELTARRATLPIEYSNRYLNTMQRDYNPLGFGFSNNMEGLGLLVDFGKLLYGTAQNAILGEDSNIGIIEHREFDRGFRDYVRENYGRRAYSQLADGEEVEGKTARDILNEFMDSSGMYEERDRADRELFLERAEKAWIDAEQVRQYQEEAEYAERMARQEYLAKGMFENFSLASLIEMIDDEIATLNDALELQELEAVLGGVKTTSAEYVRFQIDRLRQEQEIQENYINEFKASLEEHRELMAQMEETRINPETGREMSDEDLEHMRNSLAGEERKLEELETHYAQDSAERRLKDEQLQVQEVLVGVNNRLEEIEHNRQMSNIESRLVMDRESPEYIAYQLQDTREYIEDLTDVLSELRSQNLLDPDDELTRQIRSLELTIGSAREDMKNLAISQITDYKPGLELFDLRQEVEMLRTQVGLGTADTNNPVIQALEKSQGQAMVAEIDKIIAEKQQEMLEPGKDMETLNKYEREILALEQQSLRVQLGMLEEMRGGGTFNLPEGFQAMSELDYMMAMGTHSSFNIGVGDTHVNVVMPNVSHLTTPEQIQQIAYSFAQGMANGKLSSYRHMLTGGPWGYKALL